VPDDDLRRALPTPLANAVNTLALRDPVELDALVVIDQPAESRSRPVVYWDGTAKLKNASLKTGVDWDGVTGAISVRGRHGGEKLEDIVGNVYLEQARVLNQPLEKVHIPLAVWKSSPDILRLPDLKAGFFGGTLGGEGRIEFGSIFRYEMLLQASQVQLEQFGRHNFGSSAELSGQATAALHLTGEGTDLEGVKGNGRLDVPVGKLYRLPLLLDLLKWLGLGRADRTAFDQALARFRIDGPRMHVTQLALYGRAVSLRGQGSMNLDGTDLNVDLNADWGRLPQLLPPGLSDVSRGLNDQLLRIMVRGSLADVRFEKEFVPLVTDPLKKLFGAASEPSGQRTMNP
jgi:hypothetical protein